MVMALVSLLTLLSPPKQVTTLSLLHRSFHQQRRQVMAGVLHHHVDKKRKLSSSDKQSGNSNSPQHNNVKKKKKKTFKRIFCDLDGVLVDFDAGVEKLCGRRPKDLPAGVMWGRISRVPSFFEDLDWTPDGQDLWEAILPLAPTILTGVSRAKSVPYDKYEWCKRELCVETHHINMAGPKKTHVHVPHPSSSSPNNDTDDDGNDGDNPPARSRRPHPKSTAVITCWSKQKHCESGPGHILIDDRQDLQANWQAAGGTFVWHTSTASTLRILRNLQILPPEEEEKDTIDQQTEDKE